jgi:hypothetical protein
MMGLGKLAGRLDLTNSRLLEFMTPPFIRTTVKVTPCSFVIAAVYLTLKPPYQLFQQTIC